MSNEERWDVFINELRAYGDERHLGPSKHTSHYNQCRYFRKKMKEGALDEEKIRKLEDILVMRDFSIHTGGIRKATMSDCK